MHAVVVVVASRLSLVEQAYMFGGLPPPGAL